MLSSIDIPSQILESSWQDMSLYTVHPNDPETNVQLQYNPEYPIEPVTTTPIEETRTQDNDRRLTHLTASHLAPLVDLHMHFQDLPNFIHHPDFDHFAYCWMESQHYLALSKHVEYRLTVMTWFASSSTQIASIASNYPSTVSKEEEDPEASTTHIKAAYQRLAHYFNIMHKVIYSIEQGRLIHRSPQEVMLPIFNQLLEKAFNQQQPPFNTITANIPPRLTNPSPAPVAPISVPPSLNHSYTSTPSQAQSSSLEFPPDHLHLLPSEYLSMSTPVTPNSIDTESSYFWPHHATPNQLQQQHPDQSPSISSFGTLSPSPIDTTKSETLSTIAPMQLDSLHNHHDLEDPTPDEQDSDYQQSSMEEDVDEEEEEEEEEENDYEEEDNINRAGPKGNPIDSSFTTTKTNHHYNVNQQNQSNESNTKKRKPPTRRNNFPRRGRTATSYDDDTTHFLKAMFFNIYSQRDKLTKDQRRHVVEKTGLKPRNVTYWFSNHKRRFQEALDVFKKLVAESNGRIQTYDDFIQWRRENGLPEDITDNRT